jgi:hypothetical protein
MTTRVVEAAAERQAASAHGHDVAGKAKRPRARDLSLERDVRVLEVAALIGDQRVAEVDVALEPEARRRLETRHAIAIADLDGTAYDQEPLGSRLGDRAPGLAHELHERRCGAVEDGDLRSVQLHADVVDTEARQGRHQVLDRADGRRVTTERGREPSLEDIVCVGLDLDRAPLRVPEIRPREHDASARRSGDQGHLDQSPAVKGDTGGADP